MPPALIPLALLEAIQNIDTPPDDGLGALEPELAAKRLGLSPTVSAQAARYRQQTRAQREVSDDEVLAVFRLVGRRPDAALVYADAGRRAARYSARRLGAHRRVLIAAAPGKMGTRLALDAATRTATEWLLAPATASEGRFRCELMDTPALQARADGVACEFYTAAFGELLRQVGDLEWSVLHEQCIGRGDRCCLWFGMPAEAYE